MTELKNSKEYGNGNRMFVPTGEMVENDSCAENSRVAAHSSLTNNATDYNANTYDATAYDDDVSVLAPHIITRMPDLSGYGGAAPSPISLFRAKRTRFIWNTDMLKNFSLPKLCAFGAVCCVVAVLVWCLFANHKDDLPESADNSPKKDAETVPFMAENREKLPQQPQTPKTENNILFGTHAAENSQPNAAQQVPSFSPISSQPQNNYYGQSPALSNDFFASQSIVPADVPPASFPNPQQDVSSWNHGQAAGNNFNNSAAAMQNQIPASNPNWNQENANQFAGMNPPQMNFNDVPVYNPSIGNGSVQPAVQPTAPGYQDYVQPTAFQDYHQQTANNQNAAAYNNNRNQPAYNAGFNNDPRYQPIENYPQPTPQYEERVAFNTNGMSSYPQNNVANNNVPQGYYQQNPSYNNQQYPQQQQQQQYPPSYQDYAQQQQYRGNSQNMTQQTGMTVNNGITSNVPVIASAQSFRDQNSAPITVSNANAVPESRPAYNAVNDNNRVIMSQTPAGYYR